MSEPAKAGAPTRCTGLRRISDLSVDALGSPWGREPRHVPAQALPAPFVDLLSTADVDALVSRHGLRTPFLRVARDGRTLADEDFTLGGGVGAAVGDQLDDTALLRLFAEGHTLVLQGLHRSHPPILTFAQDLAADLGHPVQVNAYVTPAQSRGFAPHYDVHDVFVLQCEGQKRWRLHPPVLTHPLRDQPWQDHRGPVEEAAKGEPHLDLVLRPGDSLYIPRGWLHSATALGEVSTHLTVGVHVWTRAHVADALLESARRALAADAEQRAPLPPGVDVGDPDALREDLAAVRTALLDALAAVDEASVAARLRRRHRAAQRPAPVAPVATARALADGLPGRTVVPRAHLLASLERTAHGVVLVSRAGRVRLTDDEAATVSAWLDGATTQLPADLARRLVEHGVAVTDDEPPA